MQTPMGGIPRLMEFLRKTLIVAGSVNIIFVLATSDVINDVWSRYLLLTMVCLVTMTALIEPGNQ